MSLKTSGIITAAGANTRMKTDQINNKEVILHTITNMLKTNIDECIIVVGHYKDQINTVISKIDDDKIK